MTAQPSDFNTKSIPLSDKEQSKYLIWPNQNLHSENSNLESDLDTHMVFEYNEGDIILGYKAPRSNRFYFVTDPNGASFNQMEPYHAYLESN